MLALAGWRLADSIAELEHELRSCDDAVIIHHCEHGDFSRWVDEVLGDPLLAAAIRPHRARRTLWRRQPRRGQGGTLRRHTAALPGMTPTGHAAGITVNRSHQSKHREVTAPA